MMREAVRRKLYTVILALLACLLTREVCITAVAQGMATGGTAVAARPLAPGMKSPEVDYKDIAAQAAVTGRNVSGAEQDPQYLVETTGTGVAIFDYDNDGLPDIFLVNANRLQKGGTEPTHYLYHNLGGLKFEDVTAKSGLTHSGWPQGVCAGDIDNDGLTDLVVTEWGHNVLFRNRGKGTFRDETTERGLATEKPRWSTGCAFFDFNRDGYLDLVVAHYVDFDIAKTPRAGDKAECVWKGTPVMCGPRGLPGETVSLFENDGKGHFTDVSERTHIAGRKDYYCFTPLTGDFDNDGWPDIYIACDSTPSLFYHNVGGKWFEEMGIIAGVAVNEDGRQQAGMGTTAGDANGSGFLDIFKTNFAQDTPTFYSNVGKNHFQDTTIPSGLAVSTNYLSWGTAFLDVDNDGWKDLIIASGHIYPQVDNAGGGESFKQARQLFWNRRDGRFFDLSALGGPGIRAPHSSRGLAVGDLDNDGDLEVVIVNLNEPPTLLKNFGPITGNSMLIRAVNRAGSDAIGARVTVTSSNHRQFDEVRSGGSFISQSDFRLHFGLGEAVSADVSVRWPDGLVESFFAVAANQIVTAQEGKGIIRKQVFTRARE